MAEMEHAEYARIAASEDDHWWYRATRALMAQMLGPWLRDGIDVLDAGCGPGGNSAWLSAYGRVRGVDPSPEALRLARARHPQLEAVEGDIAALAFAPDSFDVALAITVLALVEDDRLAVSELARVLRPGGVALLLEPAIPSLRRDHDEVVRARRRYRLGELCGLATGAGLQVRRATYAFSFLVPPAFALGTWHRLRGAPQDRRTSDLERPRLDRIFAWAAEQERRLLRRRDLPIGLSAVVVATAPQAGRSQRV